MKRFRFMLLLLVVCLAIGLLGGCGGSDKDDSSKAASSDDPIKVGVILPLTGTQAMFGEMEKNTMEMVYEKLKAEGKTVINGREVKLIFEDDQSKQDVAKAATEKLVNQDKVDLLSGGYSSACTNVIAGSAQSMGVPFIINTGSADEITKQGWEWIFRGAAAPASKYTVALWDMMEEVIKPESVGILYENTDFGTSSAEGFRPECEKRGIEIVFDQSYEAGAIDFKPMLSKMKAAKPDIIFATSYVMDAALIVKQMKELDFNTGMFIGAGAGYTMPEFAENAGSVADFIASTALWVPNVAWEGAGEYFDGYVEKFGKEPDYHGAQADATMNIIIDALNRADEISKEGIKKALKETDIMTIMGPMKFEDWEGYTNQNKPTTYVVQWIDGNLEVVWPEEAASAEYLYPVPTWKER